MFATISDRFFELAQAAADRPFLTHPDGSQMTYGGAGRQVAQISNLLVRLGVKPGDRVALQAEKSARALLVYLAVIRAGAIFLPLNTAYTVAELRYFLSDARPGLFICRSEDEAVMATLCSELSIPHLLALDAAGRGSLAEKADREEDEFAPVPRSANDLAAILYTSGTTGRSKGAMLSHGNLVSNAEVLKVFWRFTAADRLLHALPIFHTHGLFVATNITICAGSSLIFLPRFDLADLLRLMPLATCLMGVPTFYSRLLSSPNFTKELASHMRLFVSGSAPLSAETHREFSERTGKAILERYGMTETNMNTSNPYEGLRKPGSVGFALPGTQLRIADPETGRELAQGEIGVIEVKGPNVFQGYWQMPEKTAEEFRSNGFFITGDLGFIDPDGYIHISGRAKDLIISGGFNIYPAEVEDLLDSLPDVAESAVIGVPHPDLGEAVVAVVQSRVQAPDESAVLAAISTKLARFKQPRRVIFVSELPRNTMGKIQKKDLREAYAGLFAGSAVQPCG